MKRPLFLIAMLCVMAFPLRGSAQSTSGDATKSLDMARNMIKVALGITNDFVNYKGDFLQKDGSGNSYYSVKDLDMGTNSQYVIVRANGGYTYAAIFEPKDGDDKTPVLAFAAFTGGIITVRANSDISVQQDPAGTQGTTLKYYMLAKDIKIASFTYDTGTKSGTLLVAIQ